MRFCCSQTPERHVFLSRGPIISDFFILKKGADIKMGGRIIDLVKLKISITMF